MSERLSDRLNRFVLLSFTFSAAIFFLCLNASAATYSVPQTTGAEIAWDHNDPMPEGYRIYQRKSGENYDYNNPVWTGAGNSGTVYNLDYDTPYYFVVRAFEGSEESVDSEEVSFMAQAPNPATYSISATANEGGAISPEGVVVVTEGADQTYTISPNQGYQISDVKVDGVSQGTLEAYTFSIISEDHTIIATFEAIPITNDDTESSGAETSPSDHIISDSINIGNDGINLLIEAEDGNIALPMQIAGEESASEGGYIWTVPETPVQDGTYSTVGYATYYFQIQEAGDYHLWIRQMPNDSYSGSLYVTVDDSDGITWRTQYSNCSGWVWDSVSEEVSGDLYPLSSPFIYRLEEGEHKLIIEQIENRNKLDQIFITNTENAPSDLIPLNVAAVASSQESVDLTAAQAVDGEPTTRWASEFSDSQWIYVDLGSRYLVNRVRLDWETAYGAQYEIQVSDNALEWNTIHTEYNGDGGVDEISISPTEARYVRMNGIKRGTVWGYSLFEFEVYGVLSSSPSDLIPLNVAAVASSQESVDLTAAQAVDGEPTTRWASEFSDSQWIYVDLGSRYLVNRVRLDWETAYGAQYEIQVSDNALEWNTIHTEYNGDGGIDEISISPTEARYVRMNGIKRGTVWGYSLFEFEVY